MRVATLPRLALAAAILIGIAATQCDPFVAVGLADKTPEPQPTPTPSPTADATAPPSDSGGGDSSAPLDGSKDALAVDASNSCTSSADCGAFGMCCITTAGRHCFANSDPVGDAAACKIRIDCDPQSCDLDACCLDVDRREARCGLTCVSSPTKGKLCNPGDACPGTGVTCQKATCFGNVIQVCAAPNFGSPLCAVQ